MEIHVEDERLIEVMRRLLEVVERIERRLEREFNRVLGGVITQQGEPGMPLNPIQPGQTVKFLVTPSFSGAPFTTVGAQAAISSSDPVNFPVALDLTDDPSGLTFEAAIPSTATPVGGSEAVTVTWTYTNVDGTVATVIGPVTELGIVDDVTGGTFSQVA